MHTAAGPTQARSGLGHRRAPLHPQHPQHPQHPRLSSVPLPESFTSITHVDRWYDLLPIAASSAGCCSLTPITARSKNSPPCHAFPRLSRMMSAASAAVCVMIRASEALSFRRSVSSFAASKSHGSDTRRPLTASRPSGVVSGNIWGGRGGTLREFG